MSQSGNRFRALTTLPGKLYLPGPGGAGKHPCADCFACQWCSDPRCAACRGEDPAPEGQPAPRHQATNK